MSGLCTGVNLFKGTTRAFHQRFSTAFYAEKQRMMHTGDIIVADEAERIDGSFGNFAKFFWIIICLAYVLELISLIWPLIKSFHLSFRRHLLEHLDDNPADESYRPPLPPFPPPLKKRMGDRCLSHAADHV